MTTAPLNHHWPKTLFVSGTDTDIGKTVVSGILASGLGAAYWKPVQAGQEPTTDAATISAWIGSEHILPTTYDLLEACSPNQAAESEQVTIELDRFECPNHPGHLVVEGAGGLWVPLNQQDTMLDLIQHLRLPTVLVARSSLGTLNHTLLSIEALHNRQLPILGVILVGAEHPKNQRDIEHFGQVKVLGRVPRLAELSQTSLSEAFSQLVGPLAPD